MRVEYFYNLDIIHFHSTKACSPEIHGSFCLLAVDMALWMLCSVVLGMVLWTAAGFA